MSLGDPLGAGKIRLYDSYEATKESMLQFERFAKKSENVKMLDDSNQTIGITHHSIGLGKLKVYGARLYPLVLICLLIPSAQATYQSFWHIKILPNKSLQPTPSARLSSGVRRPRPGRGRSPEIA